jgi:hypothetical protein
MCRGELPLPEVRTNVTVTATDQVCGGCNAQKTGVLGDDTCAML